MYHIATISNLILVTQLYPRSWYHNNMCETFMDSSLKSGRNLVMLIID